MIQAIKIAKINKISKKAELLDCDKSATHPTKMFTYVCNFWVNFILCCILCSAWKLVTF